VKFSRLFYFGFVSIGGSERARAEVLHDAQGVVTAKGDG
jgi:hypothetical protein